MKLTPVSQKYNHNFKEIESSNWKVTSIDVLRIREKEDTVRFTINLERKGIIYILKYICPAIVAALLVIVMLIIRPDFKVKYILGEFQMVNVRLKPNPF